MDESSKFLELWTLNFELRIVPFSYVARFTRHGRWRWAAFLNILFGDSDSAHLQYVRRGIKR